MEHRENGRLQLLPAEPGNCGVCNRDHKPQEPHDCAKLFYQVGFRLKHGRDPTWHDAAAHITDEDVRKLWLECARVVEAEHGREFRDLPDGVEPIAMEYVKTTGK